MLFFITVVLAMAALDLALDAYVRRNTTTGRFIEEARSKTTHMRLFLHGSKPDIVFVGSSTTLYHISQSVFAEQGMAIHNLGVSGAQLVNYASMVDDALASGAKTVVLGLSPNEFVQDSVPYAPVQDLRDLRAMVEADVPWPLLLRAAKDYVRRLHSLLIYSEPMFLRLRQLASRFEVSVSEPAVANFKRSGAQAGDTLPEPVIPEKVDCDIFDVNRVSPYKIVTKCTNGDGIIFGNRPPGDAAPVAITGRPLNQAYVRLLNLCIDTIRRSGATPLIVLYPTMQRVDEAGLAAIRAATPAMVVDDSGYASTPDMWADSSHLNYAGRLRYSRHLAREIKEIKSVTR